MKCDVVSRKRASNTMDSSATGLAPGRSGPNCAPRNSRCVAPDPRRVGRRRHPALRLDMRQSSENLKPVDAESPRVLIPGNGAGRLVDEKRRRVGVVDSHASGADAESAGEGAQRRVGRELGVKLERDRPLGGQGRRPFVERLKVGEAEIVPLDREGRRVPVRGLRRNCPRSRRTRRRDRGVRPRARMIESDGEVVVDDGALRRFVLDLEMAVGERKPIERLGRRRPWFRRRRGRRRQAPGALPPAEGRARQRDWGRARIAGDSKRQRAIGGDAQAQVEPVELKPAHPDVEQRRGKRIEAKFAARRRKDRSAGGVAHGEALEAETHAPRIVHEIGRSEIDGVTVADALLEGGLDLVVHADEPKGPSRQQRSQRQSADDEQGRGEFHSPETNVGDAAARGCGASASEGEGPQRPPPCCAWRPGREPASSCYTERPIPITLRGASNVKRNLR